MYEAISVPVLKWIPPPKNETKTKPISSKNGTGYLSLNTISTRSVVKDVQWIEGSMRLRYDDYHEIPVGKSMRGLYFAKDGVMYMKTVENKHENWTDLIRYLSNEDHAILVKTMLQERDSNTYSKEKRYSNDTSELSLHDDVVRVVPTARLSECEFGLVGKLENLSGKMSASELQLVEDEWMNPTGLSSKKPPSYRITGLGFSQKCNLTWQIKGNGLRLEQIQRKGLNYGLMVMTVRSNFSVT